VLAQLIVTAVAAPSGAAPRTSGVDAAEAAAERDRRWHAGIGIGADIPVDALNVGFVIQAPSGLRLSSSVGFLTDVFLGLMDDGDQAASVMHAALRNSVVWRTHLGVKPWNTHGFYAAAGYSLCSFGGAITSGAAISVLLDRMLPVDLGSDSVVHMSSTLHALDLEAGWEWSIARHFTVRTAIGAAMVLAASTSLQIDAGSLAFLPTDQLIAPVERAGEAEINARYKQAGPIVMLTVQLQVDLL